MRSLSLLLILCLLVPCCATKKKKGKEKTGPVTLIGMIEMVNPEQNYVLIRCELMPNLSAGSELTAVSADGKKAKLILSPERKGHYLTADIKEGLPTVNSLVLLPTGAEVPPPATPPAPPPVPVSPPSTLKLPELPFIPLNLPPLTTSPTPPANPAQPGAETAPNPGDLEPPVK